MFTLFRYDEQKEEWYECGEFDDRDDVQHQIHSIILASPESSVVVKVFWSELHLDLDQIKLPTFKKG